MRATGVGAKVVEPYAEALMSLAQSQNITEQIAEELRSLISLLAESNELQVFLDSPIVKAEDKKAVLQRIGGEGMNPYLTKFLMLLVDRRRIMFLEAIAERYLELVRKLNNVVLAQVISAIPMTEAQQQTVSEKVKALTEANSVEIQVKVEPDLIGGVIIKVGSQVYDASLRGQLRRIGMNLTGKA